MPISMRIRRAAPWVAAAVALALLVALSACDQARQARDQRTARDDIRTSCAGAARAYGLAIQHASAGTLSPTAFAAIAEAYAVAHDVCRGVLEDGKPPAPGDLQAVAGFAGYAAATMEPAIKPTINPGKPQ